MRSWSGLQTRRMRRSLSRRSSTEYFSTQRAASWQWAGDWRRRHPNLSRLPRTSTVHASGLQPQAQAIAAAATALGKDAEKIVAGAKKLGEAKDIAAARTAFGDVSQALADYAQKTKSGFGPDVKLAYCPMADKPWLQKDKDIKNPYYGPSQTSYDAWIGYRRKFQKFSWSVQLNVRNIGVGDELIPVSAQPDGTPNSWRIRESQTWSLRNTFTF